jgi:hypothetical protein
MMENNEKQNQTNVEPLINQAKANKGNEGYFNVVVDEIPYRVEFEPFFFNDQVRYYVRVNAGPQDVFVWDTEVELFRAIDDNAGVMPVGLEKAISAKLQTQDLN